ncbi:MAG: CDP-glucose 4,6-dehydratase [Acidimicrobiales bacterium]
MGASFWNGRRVLVTGHTGFKGAWLSLWLERLGADVYGLGLAPAGSGGAYEALSKPTGGEALFDIRNRERVRAEMEGWRPEVVFHLAAQALVRAGYQDPIGTYETNVLGTVNTLAAAAAAGAQAVVVATSDKVYANDGSGRAFKEADPLGGRDPYSSSKACADLAAQAWRCLEESAGTAIGVARAGNVIGGGDEAEDRLLPDAWRAVQAGQALQLRHPDSVRPWQFVLDPLLGYLLMAERLVSDPSNTPPVVNFGPDLASCRPVREVVDLAYAGLGRGSWQIEEGSHPEEAAILRLDASRAEQALGWKPRLDLVAAVEWTVAWWRGDLAGDDLRGLAMDQIAAYESLR